MSALFAASGLVMAYLSRRAGHTSRVQLPILYFSAMELLQTVQYLVLAVPEDDYAQCANPINQYLTVIGIVHICFQPYFCHMIVTGPSRQLEVRYRFENDMVSKLAIAAGVWHLLRYGLAILGYEGDRPSEACPNYEWIRDGYDANIEWTTPNLPGHSCTFQSNTPTGHLAWAVPLAPASYFVPGTSLHFFLMFAPALVTARHFITGVVSLLTGPVLALVLTHSLSEQASIWCFFSMFQCLLAFIAAFLSDMKYGRETNPVVEHAGSLGEAPMHYVLKAPTANGKKTQ